MSDGLSKTYNPKEHEERIYRWWEEQGYFRPEKQVELGLASKDGPRWCITMPPPNGREMSGPPQVRTSRRLGRAAVGRSKAEPGA